MRIIGGTARGRSLLAPEGWATRPTADRTREALFNILMRHVPGAAVLDLFSGSGALAAEALSRGAAEAVCVDISPDACRIIEKNCALSGVRGTAHVLCADWHSALASLHTPFDIVFLDPPYVLTELYGRAFSALVERRLLTGESIVVMEHEKGLKFPLPPQAEVYDARSYGKAGLLFVRLKEETI